MEAYDRRGTDRTWHVIDAVQKIAGDRGGDLPCAH
jgi:hypothetical protein